MACLTYISQWKTRIKCLIQRMEWIQSTCGKYTSIPKLAGRIYSGNLEYTSSKTHFTKLKTFDWTKSPDRIIWKRWTLYVSVTFFPGQFLWNAQGIQPKSQIRRIRTFSWNNNLNVCSQIFPGKEVQRYHNFLYLFCIIYFPWKNFIYFSNCS